MAKSTSGGKTSYFLSLFSGNNVQIDQSNAAMRNKTLIAVAASAVCASSAFGNDIDASFYAGYDTNYIWRGQDLGNDLYSYGVDASGSCDCGLDWSAGIWKGSADTGADSGTDIDELDIFGGVSKDLGFATASLGFIHYTYNDESDEDTTEIVLGFSKTVGAVDLAVNWYEDVDGEDNSYFEFSADHSRELSSNATLNLGVNFGNWANDDDDFLTYGVSAGVDFGLSDALTLSTYVAAEWTEGTTESGSEDDEVFGGASISFSL